VNATATLDQKYGLSDTIGPKSASAHCDVAGLAKVVETVNGQAPSGTQSFTFTLRQGADPMHDGTILQTLVANAGNGGVLNFTPNLNPLPPDNHYQMCEDVLPGWNTSRQAPNRRRPATSAFRCFMTRPFRRRRRAAAARHLSPLRRDQAPAGPRPLPAARPQQSRLPGGLRP
jgi:hypothetical protein